METNSHYSWKHYVILIEQYSEKQYFRVIHRLTIVLLLVLICLVCSFTARAETQNCTPMITAYDCGGKYGTPGNKRCYPNARGIQVTLKHLDTISTYPPPTVLRFTFNVSFSASGYQAVPTAPFKAVLYTRIDNLVPQIIANVSSNNILPPSTYWSCVSINQEVCYTVGVPTNATTVKFWLKAYQTTTQGYAYCLCESDTVDFAVAGATPVSGPDFATPLMAEQGPTSCEKSVADPINVTNGNMFLVREDFIISSDLGDDFLFKRYYNSYTSDTLSSLGGSWRHSLEYSLALDSASGDLVLTEATGRQIRIRKHVLNYGYGSITTYSFPYSAPYRITVDTATSNYVLSLKDDTKLFFTGLGAPDSITNMSNYGLKLYYTGSVLDSVKNASSRKVNFGYSSGKLAAIMSASGDTLVKYEYHTGSGLLKKVVHLGDSWEQYDYGAGTFGGRGITMISNSDGQNRYFEYDADGRAVENRLAGGHEKVNLNWEWADTCGCNRDSEPFTANVGYQNGFLESEYRFIWAPFDSQRIVVNRSDADCAGCATEFAYDGNGLKKVITHPNGAIDSVWYDGRGNLLTSILSANSADRQVTEMRFDSLFNSPTIVRRPSVAKTASDYDSLIFSYDAKGNVTRVIETGWKSATAKYCDSTFMTYNTLGQLIKYDGPRRDVADTVKMVYYSNGDLQYVILPNADTTTFGQRNSLGHRTWVRSCHGDTTRLFYDPRGRLVRYVGLAGTADSAATSIAYNAEGRLASIVTANGTTIEADYDSTGYLTKLIDGLDNYSTFSHDSTGNVGGSAIYSADNSLRWYQFYLNNNKHQLDWVAGPAGDTTRFNYEAGGRPDTVFNPAGVRSVQRYDLLGRIAGQVVPWAADSARVTLSYNTQNSVTKVVDPDGYQYAYRYDGKGRLTFDSCAVTGVTTYGYDAANNLTWTKNAAGDSIAFKYDLLNRLTAVLHPDSQNVRYAYDGNEFNYGKSRLYKESAPACTTRYRYDQLGRIIQELRRFPSDTATYTTSYGYDKSHNLTSITYPSGTQVGYDYDSTDNVIRVRCYVGGVWDTLVTGVSYAPFGGAESWTLGNGVGITNRYDSRYLLDSLSTGVDSLVEYRYSYDVVGNITAIANRYDSLASRQFDYDDLGRLTLARSADYPDTLVRYHCTRNGNRDSVIFSGSVIDTAVYSYSNNRLNQIVGDSTVTFAYDNLGNVTKQIIGTDTTTFAYNDAGRLVSIDGGAVASYAYDGMHRRVKKTIGGSGRKFIPAGNGFVLSEYDLNGIWQGDLIYFNGRPLAKLTSGSIDSVMYFVNDHLGTPVALIDNAKQIRWSAKWYPFGEIYDEQVSANNYLRFPGQWEDDEHELSYNWHRYYSPKEGRYYQADPLGLSAGVSLYGYVSSNPLVSFDPYGLYSANDFLEDAGQFLVGLGDAASFGITRKIRQQSWYGGDCFTDKNSTAYRLGSWTGVGAISVATAGATLEINAGQMALKSAIGASPVWNSAIAQWTRSNFFRWGWQRFRGTAGGQVLHFHLPFGSRGLGAHHLPQQARTYLYHLLSKLWNL